MKSRLLILSSLLLIIFTASGCTLKVPMHPNTGQLGISEKIPGRAALYITDEKQKYVFSGKPESFTAGLKPHEFPLGMALEEASLQTFSQVFEKVQIVRNLADAAKYEIMLEPSIEEFHFRYDQLSYGGFAVAAVSKIKVRVTLATGQSKFWERTVESPEQRKGPWVVSMSYEKEMGDAASDALVYTLKKIAMEISTDSSVKETVMNKPVKQKYVKIIGSPKNEGIISPKPPVAKKYQSTDPEDIGSIPDFDIGPNNNYLAVIIGIEKYQNVPPSDYSESDAGLTRDYLRALGFRDGNMDYLANERATYTSIKRSIETWLPNRVKKNSKVFVYFSGHGAPEMSSGQAYILPYDGDPNYLVDTAYPLDRLYEKLALLEASEIIVVMDSCFSGAGGRSVLAKGARPLVMLKDSRVSSRRMAVMTATQGSQISTSSAEKGHGIFTFYFLKAIKDGKKNIPEIYEYIKPLVEDEAKTLNVQQSPNLFPSPEKLSGKFGLRE